MDSLRRARFLARLVLAWFALSLGVAIASPLLHPQTFELLCSGGGTVKLLVKNDDGTPAGATHTLDCPLCASTAAPPPVALAARLPSPLPLGRVVQSIPSARVAALTSGPLPARGPPAETTT